MFRLVFVAALLAACTATAPPGASPTATSTSVLPTVGAATPAPPTPTTVPPTAAPTPTAPPTVGPAITPPAGFQIVIGTDESGAYLVTPDGYSLYTFDNDSPGESACNGNCAETWPPFQTGGLSVGGDAGVSGTFGTIARDDGVAQITYNDAPLYFYSGDASPGDINGDGIGGVWHLAAP